MDRSGAAVSTAAPAVDGAYRDPEVAPSEPARFPFGTPSGARSLRAATGTPDVLVVGLYPSAVNVRWEPPSWLRDVGIAVEPVRSLGIADEPVMFWDGSTPAFDLTAWVAAVGFRSGDAWPAWGHVPKLGQNGAAWRAVEREVLDPLGITADDVGFTDVVHRFHCKARRVGDDGKIVERLYHPFVEALRHAGEEAPPFASVPTRPKAAELVASAVDLEAERLCSEIGSSRSRLVVTLGEEARQVVSAIADRVTGAPTEPLAVDNGRYGAPGTGRIAGRTFAWVALATPGQPPGPWRRAHDAWCNGDNR